MDAWLTANDVGRTLASYSVATDDEYLAKRESLPAEIRKTLDRARYEAIRHALPADDPFLLASAVPLDFDSLPLDHLILSTRCRRVLARKGIATVRDLVGRRLAECLLHWKNFGRGSATELAAKLRSAIDRALTSPHDEECSTLGFDNRVHSLEGIADRYDVTHQRIDRLTATDVGRTVARYSVATDDEYLAKRESLPPEIRKTLDRARYEAIRHALPANDPFLLASAVPLDFGSLPLDQLILSTRCRQVLEREGIATVRDLVGRRLGECLLHWKNFGRGAATELAAKLRNPIDRALSSPHDEERSTVLSVLNEEMSWLSDRNREIVKARLGVDDRVHTLEELAGRYDVTRQRIEQIVNRWFRSIRTRPWFRELTEHLERLFQDRRQPLYLDLLENEDPWFGGFTEFADVGAAIKLLADDRFFVIEAAGLNVIARITQQTWDRLPSQAVAYLKTLGSALSESETKLATEGVAESNGAAELGDLLYAIIRDRLQFAEQQFGELRLSSIGRGLVHHLTAVMEDAEKPLHYTKIAARCSERLGREVNPASAANVLGQVGAKYYGRGQWALPRHFELSDDLRDELVREVETFVKAGQPDRQWHIDELVELLQPRLAATDRNINKYVLNFALESSSIVVSKGRFVWALKTHADRFRIDVQEAFETTLEQHGGPMSLAEIKAELNNRRGLGQYLNIVANSRRLKVAPGTWGLLERDFHLSHDRAEEIRALVFDLLRARGRPLADADVRNVLTVAERTTLTPYMLASLLQIDSRFHVRRGHKLALTEGGVVA